MSFKEDYTNIQHELVSLLTEELFIGSWLDWKLWAT